MIVFFSLPLTGQFFAGIGYYENVFFGCDLMKRKNIVIRNAIGLLPGFKNQQYTASYFINLERKVKTYKNNSRLGANGKFTAWWLTNQWNDFLCIIPSFEVSYSHRIKGIEFNAAAGIGFNFVPFYRRKTYAEVGWPREWSPTISLFFPIKKSKK